MTLWTTITAIVGTLLTAIFAIVTFLVGRRQADKGFMDQGSRVDRWPASLVFDDDMPPGVVEDFQDAIDWWNRGLGARAFTDIGDLGPGATVSVDWGEGDDFDMRFVFEPGDEFPRILVNRRLMVLGVNLLRRCCHELGHVLKLAHDLDRRSVMYASAEDGDFVLTDADRRRVRSMIWPS